MDEVDVGVAEGLAGVDFMAETNGGNNGDDLPSGSLSLSLSNEYRIRMNQWAFCKGGSSPNGRILLNSHRWICRV
jgi:hypothetical protein